MTERRERPDLDAHPEDTIPPEGNLDSSFFFARVTEEALRHVADNVSGKALDLAAGMGLDTKELCRRGMKVVSLEPSEKTIRFAQSICSELENKPQLVMGFSEELPFKNSAFDTVLIKGAIDHFVDPADFMKELKRVISADGRAVIAVANFDSLSVKLSRAFHFVRNIFTGKPTRIRPHHEMPADHITRFTRTNMLELISHDFITVKEVGISLMWGVPYWGKCLGVLPDGVALKILKTLDLGARKLPGLADMLVYVIRPKSARG